MESSLEMDEDLKAAIRLLIALCDADVVMVGASRCFYRPGLDRLMTDAAIDGLATAKEILSTWLELRENELRENELRENRDSSEESSKSTPTAVNPYPDGIENADFSHL